ncbi:MAG: GNAT family N-acetyltransferase [Candidatus Moraniibacteriota bacterium]|nr:MAG: GNAT family N-acetyltransferase [Candidatus Moranbacteria bacterium]
MENEEEKICQELSAQGFRFSFSQEGHEIARARLYILRNDLHEKPFGFMEDVFVQEFVRGKGWGKKLIEVVREKAREMGCYKLIATSREERESVHILYKKFGFKQRGKEFRIDFEE